MREKLDIKNKVKSLFSWLRRSGIKKQDDISNLPKIKNIVDFTDKEIFHWLRNYVDGWGKGYGVTPPDQYKIVKAELIRRNNERMLRLSKVNLLLAIFVVIFAALTCWKTFFPTGVKRFEHIFQGNEMLSIDHFTGRKIRYIKDKEMGIKKEIWDKGDWRRFFISVE